MCSLRAPSPLSPSPQSSETPTPTAPPLLGTDLKPCLHFGPFSPPSVTSVSSLFISLPERIQLKDESVVVKYSFLSRTKASNIFTRSEFWIFSPKGLQFQSSLKYLQRKSLSGKVLLFLKLHTHFSPKAALLNQVCHFTQTRHPMGSEKRLS